MTLYEAMIASGHIDEDGMVLEDPNSGDGPNTGNGWHGWGVLALLSKIRGEVSNQMQADFQLCYLSSVVKNYPGLVHRGPRKVEELIAHDDLLGLCVASWSLDNGIIATYALSHIKKKAGCYDNLNPDKWSFRSLLVRHSVVLPLLRSCSNTEMGCLENCLACFTLISGSLSSSPRGRILDWMLFSTLKNSKDNSVLRAMNSWKHGLFKHFPKGMRDVFAAYYGTDHPFVEYGVGC